MKTSKAGIQLIKASEGCVLKVYKDVAGLPTIGIGHLIKQGEYYDSITEEEALELLANDLKQAETCINSMKLTLTQNQFDALVSFVFNLGCGAFKGSTLLKKLRRGDYEGAAGEFSRWNKAGGKVVQGLVRRREEERALFCS